MMLAFPVLQKAVINSAVYNVKLNIQFPKQSMQTYKTEEWQTPSPPEGASVSCLNKCNPMNQSKLKL